MDWIKKNYDRFVLLLLAVALLASSGWLIWSAKSFPECFAPLLTPVTHGKKVTNLETAAIERAKGSITTPAAWGTHPGSLLVSRKYFVKRDESGQAVLVDPFDNASNSLHPPIPNAWFREHGLADRILDTDVLDQDPDKDGFSNLDEYLGKTDPLDPNSHPPYLTKLRLKQFKKNPFRLKFEAYDGEGSFQINTVDVRQPTQFVKLGETIPGTKFTAKKFEKKSVFNPRTQLETDISELTIKHNESGLEVVLILGQVTDSPDQYARFAFLWDHTEFTVKKGDKFSLKPEPNIVYKLIDIRDEEAVITNEKTEGDPIKVPRLEAPTR